jgi:dihydroorotase
MADKVTIPLPDDFHLHLRDGAQLASVCVAAAQRFGRCIIMPNLKPPVVTTQQALDYRRRILDAIKDAKVRGEPGIIGFEPLMTLYLTDRTSPQEIRLAKESKQIFGVKLYPAGATTNSDSGVTDIKRVYPTLRAMADCGLPLLIHGEVTDSDVDIFDRETVFLERYLKPLLKEIPTLKVVLEHITTKEAVAFVRSAGPNVAATITAHHLLYHRGDLFQGGLNPHFYCLPVLKHQQHRLALIEAATSGHPKFFLGTDSAPHAKGAKEASCCAAGCYTGYAAIELYAEVFQRAGALDRLAKFAALNGAAFYGLPPAKDTITLQKRSWIAPSSYAFGNDQVVPLGAGRTIS